MSLKKSQQELLVLLSVSVWPMEATTLILQVIVHLFIIPLRLHHQFIQDMVTTDLVMEMVDLDMVIMAQGMAEAMAVEITVVATGVLM